MRIAPCPSSAVALAPGVSYSEGRFEGSRYHLVRVDREQADVDPRPFLTNRAEGDTVSRIDRLTDSVATVNGTFFDTARPGRGVYGDVKTDTEARPSGLSKMRTYWAVTPEGTYEMGETARAGTDSQGAPIYRIPTERFASYRYVLGGGGRLVRDGRKASVGAGVNDEQFLPDVLARRNRSAIGFADSGGAFWMVSCDMPGWTPQETADFFLTLGADEAMFLDGGGSTEMVVSDRIVTPLSAGAERPMPTAVVVT